MAADPDAATLPTGAALHEAKRALRAGVVAARDGLDPETRARASVAIAAKVAALPSFATAGCLLLALPFRSEWDTRALFALALGSGRTVVAPRVDEHSRMLELRSVRDLAHDIVPGYRGIPEPRLQCPLVPPGSVDWVLVPGVAFDAAGRRLGYGGGYYDRLLPLVKRGAARVAGAYDAQIVERVPAAPHDLAVDVVATETRLLVVR